MQPCDPLMNSSVRTWLISLHDEIYTLHPQIISCLPKFKFWYFSDWERTFQEPCNEDLILSGTMVKITEEESSIINEAILRWHQQPKPTLISVTHAEGKSSTLPDVMLWSPGVDCSLSCPIHKQELLYQTEHWTNNSSHNNCPRLVYSYGKNSLLISSLYKCQQCKDLWSGISPGLLCQVGAVEGRSTFQLFHKFGMRDELFSMVINNIKQGMSFNAVRSSITDSHMREWSKLCYWSGDLPSKIDFSLNAFKVPTGECIQQAFMLDFQRKKDDYIALLHQIPFKELSVDLTFKIRLVIESFFITLSIPNLLNLFY